MSFPVTINSNTYTASNFTNYGHLVNFPGIISDVATVAAQVASDKVDTAADAVSTAADAVSTAADAVTTGNNVTAAQAAQAAAETAAVSTEFPFAVSAGTGSAYTLDFTDDITIADGASFRFSAHATSGAGPTVTIDGNGPYDLVKPNGEDIGAGEIVANQNYFGTYEATGTKVIIQSGMEINTWTADKDASGYEIQNERGYSGGIIVHGTLVNGLLTKKYYAETDERIYNVNAKTGVGTVDVTMSLNGSDDIGFSGDGTDLSVTTTLTETAIDEDSNAYFDMSQGDYLEFTLASVSSAEELLILFDKIRNQV